MITCYSFIPYRSFRSHSWCHFIEKISSENLTCIRYLGTRQTGRIVVDQVEQTDNDIHPVDKQNERTDQKTVTVNRVWNQEENGQTYSDTDLGADLPSINEPVTRVTANRGKIHYSTTNTNLHNDNNRSFVSTNRGIFTYRKDHRDTFQYILLTLIHFC